MVCLGNICRSPLAEGILQSKSKDFKVDSAGTAGYHIGKQPDVRSIDIAKKHDIDLTSQRARQFNRRDFENFDKIYVKPLIGVSPKSLKILSEKFSSSISQIVNEEFNSLAKLEMLASSLPTRWTSSPLLTRLLANEDPIDPVAPKIIFFIK